MTDSDTLVGVVLGSEDATPLELWVGVRAGALLQLDELVATELVTPEGEVVTFYGLVDAVRKRFEGAQFDGDAFRAADGVLPVEVSYAAHVQITRIEPEVFVPPQPGAPVKVVRGAAYRRALGFEAMPRKLPLGSTQAGEPVFANLEFLDGERGAHASISGISGVATKTSYATFLLYGLFHSGVLGADAANTKALIFNVKGEDLLWLDHPNRRLDDVDRAHYDRLGLPATPFRDVGFYAPARAGGHTLSADTGSRRRGVSPYVWTLGDFARQRLLRFVFAEANDARAQLGFVIERVERWLAGQVEGDDPGLVVEGERILTFSELVDRLDGSLLDQITHGGRIAPGTLDAFRRRLHAAARRLGHLIRGDTDDAARRGIAWGQHQVTVVDLHTLHSTAQRFVVGVLLQRMMAEKERRGTARPLFFVVLDELNKYAPRSGWSPLSEVLLDIAERGRSLGVSLLGAQQTASEVERRVVSNASIRIVGRLDAAEAERGEYGFLPRVSRLRASLLRPGSMLVAQPEIPAPLLVRFPFPAWATRASEVDDGSDPTAEGDQRDEDLFADLFPEVDG